MYIKGKESEQVAENYLKNNGFVIHFRNKRVGRYEVDIVCEKNGVIVFVEVKSLLSDCHKKPFESVNRGKQKKIIRVADRVIHTYFPNHESRFDVISMIGGLKNYKIEHIKNAFTPEIDNS